MDVDRFLGTWARSGGAERANYAQFCVDLCDLLDVPRPNPAGPDPLANAYAFERSVTFRHGDGTTTTGRIDLYKRDCFILEAKQFVGDGVGTPTQGVGEGAARNVRVGFRDVGGEDSGKGTHALCPPARIALRS